MDSGIMHFVALSFSRFSLENLLKIFIKIIIIIIQFLESLYDNHEDEHYVTNVPGDIIPFPVFRALQSRGEDPKAVSL